ncbi:hypothetical protein IBTHAUMO2_1090015 [Nitrosopumilaceae archaeon]|nr:hypothetical protein [Nitrosopumilus sp.]CAI9830785.1 hypothetical protein IBTHAUMO2_1090015 [Nitrosopumilaceae archaeon]
MHECDLGVIANKAQLYNTMSLPVEAGQLLEAGMLVTRSGPVMAAGRGARGHTVGVIEAGCDSTAGPKVVTVFGSGAVTCVKAGRGIRADQTALKAWDHGSVAPMEEEDQPDLFVARVLGPGGVGEVRGSIPVGGHVSVMIE